ncbi:MAG: hypothetical protein JSS64_04080 [Bacteroidetes bacterium]|nr:hypothetical protein [Bacteroidota bacterium]
MKFLQSTICLIFLTTFTINSIAQTRSYGLFSGISIMGGISTLKVDETNDALNSAGLPNIPTNAAIPSFSILLNSTADPLFVDLSFASARTKSSYHAVDLRFTQTYLDVNMNYSVVNKNRHQFYPSLGFGWAMNELKLVYPSVANNFNQSLVLPATEKSYTNQYLWYINPRLSYDFALTKRHQLLLTARAGYRIGLAGKKWQIQNSNTDGPRSNASGFYALIGLTFAIPR